MKGDKGHGKGWSGWKGSQGGSKGGKGKGRVHRLNLPTANAPEIVAGTSYCYAAKHSYIDVLTPAWHCRPLVPHLPKVDLRFEALRELQTSSGGFEVSPLLLGRLGATEQEPVLNLAKDLKGRDLEVLGARLVLKAAEFYNVPDTPQTEAMCLRCKKLIEIASKDTDGLDASRKDNKALKRETWICWRLLYHIFRVVNPPFGFI